MKDMSKMPDAEAPEENERMLAAINYKIVEKEDTKFTEIPQRNRTESIREFLKTLGSLTSLKEGQNLNSTRTGIIHQCIVTSAILILTAGAGQPIGFSGVLLPQLQDANSTIPIDNEMGSWIASLHSGASPVGSLVGGFLMDKLGRKRTLELSVPLSIIGWLFIAFTPDISLLLIGRIVCGFAIGNAAAASQVYLAEIADPWLRGCLIGAPFVSYSIGILLVQAMVKVPWRWIAGSATILPLIGGIFLLFMPESPVSLIRLGRMTKAHKALLWLRGDETLAKRDMHLIAEKKAKQRQVNPDESFCSMTSSPSVYKPLIIINVFVLVQVLSGTYMVVFYPVHIIRYAAGDNSDSKTAATYTAVIRLVFAIISCFLIFRITRRALAIFSGIGSAVTMIALSIFVMVRKGEPKDETDFWVVMILLVIYIASNTVGFLLLPNLLVGELVPERVRGIWGGLIFMIFNILLFIYCKAFPFIISTIYIEGLFMIFGVSSLIGTILLYLAYPETKDKSLHQIEEYFKTNGFLWIGRKEIN